jgi:hypothetical protein
VFHFTAAGRASQSNFDLIHDLEAFFIVFWHALIDAPQSVLFVEKIVSELSHCDQWEKCTAHTNLFFVRGLLRRRPQPFQRKELVQIVRSHIREHPETSNERRSFWFGLLFRKRSLEQSKDIIGNTSAIFSFVSDAKTLPPSKS